MLGEAVGWESVSGPAVPFLTLSCDKSPCWPMGLDLGKQESHPVVMKSAVGRPSWRSPSVGSALRQAVWDEPGTCQGRARLGQARARASSHVAQ